MHRLPFVPSPGTFAVGTAGFVIAGVPPPVSNSFGAAGWLVGDRGGRPWGRRGPRVPLSVAAATLRRSRE
ncbi:MAG: hypothetical protein AVDCRST_MAG02-3717 [uncultured Rubrobacteraceae bacterium]|uniref:Uncharacterized protein n=1 Tax=uncultured Rubrobacteraceae bacterium TaxID=349277 RepID=A0A6J4RJ88_9ACTN|nr:MAG: hypothetical protein AVDCRST_MAG02-3717 [uncultured Rubrobacteraceae bacterium]